MYALRDTAQLPVMTEQTQRGAAIQTRMERMGISARQFEKEAAVERTTLKRAIEGTPGTRESTYRAIEAALDKLEEEMGIDAPTAEPGLIEFRVEGLYGAKAVIVKGPVKDKDALLEVVERLMRGQSGADDA